MSLGRESRACLVEGLRPASGGYGLGCRLRLTVRPWR